jgi:hypothetical protein
MKKKIFYIPIISVLIIVVVVLLIFSTKSVIKKSDLFDAISTNSALIIDVKNSQNFLENLKENNEIYTNFENISGININNSLIYFLDSLDKNSAIKTSIFSGRVVVSFNIEGKSNINQLCVSEIPEEVKENTYYIQLISELKKTGSIKTRNFNEVEIAEYKDTLIGQKIFLSVKNGLLLLTSTPKLMEETIIILDNNNSVNNLLEFAKVYNTAGVNELANIYVNMKKFPDMLYDKVSADYKTGISNLKYFSDWTELDLSVFDDRVILNGLSENIDTIATYSHIINSQNATEINSIRVLPNTTSYYFAMAFNDYAEYDKNLSLYLSKLGTSEQRDKNIKNLENKTGVDIRSAFYPMINSEVCYAVTSVNTKDIFENSFTIFDIKSKSVAEQELNNIIEKIAKKTNKSHESFIETIIIDERTTIPCFSMPFDDLPELLFGDYFKNCTGRYMSIIDNFIIIGNTKSSLRKIIHDAILNNTLNTSVEHNLFLEHFSKKSNMFIYFSFHKGFDILQNTLANSVKDKISSIAELVYKLGNFGYQINKSDDRLYNNIVIKQSDRIIEKPQTIWEKRLDTLIAIKPAIVINHDDNSKEIIVQDEQNSLYLLSKSGREIWKIKLDERIISPIYQIDYYKNKKLQYLFSTKSKIYLIDRLGNNIEKYPIDLRSKATAPISLFDYEGDKNYRIIVPCEDKKVYLYTKEGELLKDWGFQGTENIVNAGISHYRIKKEDFIVFNDEYKAYFLSRRGDIKLEFNTKFKFSKNNKILLDDLSKSTRFVTTDENGAIRIFDANGKLDTLKIKQFSPNHYFAIKDMNHDGNNDFVFVDGNKVEVYNSAKKLIMSYEFESTISHEPSFYNFSDNQIKIGIVCAEINQIYLLDANGSISEGFPLFGLTPFSIARINKDVNKFNLIVGGLDNLLYNYELKK